MAFVVVVGGSPHSLPGQVPTSQPEVLMRPLVTCWPRERQAAPPLALAFPSPMEPPCLLSVIVPCQCEGLSARKALPRVVTQRQGTGLSPFPRDPRHILGKPGHRGLTHCFSSHLSSFPGPSGGNSRVPFPLPVWKSFLVPAQALNPTGYLRVFPLNPRTYPITCDYWVWH